MPEPLPRHITPYEQTMLAVASAAKGWIAHEDLVLRFRTKVLPTNPRSAGVVALAEHVLQRLVLTGELERKQTGPVRVYRARKEEAQSPQCRK